MRTAVLTAVLLTGCSQAIPSAPLRTPPPSITVSGAASATASAAPDPAPSAPGIALPEPGRPWDGESLLAAMRASTRPGGVPDELETLALAETIAGAIWTVDGAAWDTTAIGGFCGASTCTLDVAGSRDDRDGEDLWTLEIDRQSGAVEPLVADVHSLPSEVISAVDGLARGLVPEIEDEELVLASVRWLPPPSGPGRFELSYRSGGEEGSCAREITVDVTRRAVLRATVTGC